MMTISKVTRVTAKSGDYSTLDLHADGSVYVGGLKLANAAELEAFGNALVDVAHEMQAALKAAVIEELSKPLDPSAEDVLIRYADEHAHEHETVAQEVRS